MKVVLVNHSDVRGGASVVTVRLLDALQAQGVDARMLVAHKATDRDDIALVGSSVSRKAAFLAEHADIFLHNGFSRDTLFKISTGRFGVSIHDHPWVREADVVVLNWINQGIVSLAEIAGIKAPVVWTMHDMWPLTGVCHHSVECIAYKRDCGHCRLLHGGTSDYDLSRRTWLAKKQLYNRKPIHFVAVSHWLERKCRESSLLCGRPVSVIPNAFPVEEFSATPSAPRHAYGLPGKGPLVVMGAARLDDPIKGLDMAVEALNKVRDTGATAVFFGSLRDKKALDSLRLPHVWLGPIKDKKALADIYAHSDVVLSTSHYETLPGTLIEGMASGCVPVTFGRGGQADIVDHMTTGYIANYPNADDIAEGIRYALADRFDRDRIRRAVASKFASSTVASQYIELFDSLLNPKNL